MHSPRQPKKLVCFSTQLGAKIFAQEIQIAVLALPMVKPQNHFARIESFEMGNFRRCHALL